MTQFTDEQARERFWRQFSAPLDFEHDLNGAMGLVESVSGRALLTLEAERDRAVAERTFSCTERRPY